MKYYLYILKTLSDTLYTGITNNVLKRYEAHLNGKGAKYTKSHKPKELVYLDVLEDKPCALKEEYRIKTLSRKEKLALIEKNKARTKKIYSIIEEEFKRKKVENEIT